MGNDIGRERALKMGDWGWNWGIIGAGVLRMVFYKVGFREVLRWRRMDVSSIRPVLDYDSTLRLTSKLVTRICVKARGT